MVLLFFACTPDAPILLGNSNSMTAKKSLELPVYRVAADQSTVIDWSGRTTNLLGGPASTITEVQLTGFNSLTEAEIEEGLLSNTLAQTAIRIQFFCLPAATQCAFSDFSVFAHSFAFSDYFVESGVTWMLSFWSENVVEGLAFVEVGEDARADYGESRLRLEEAAAERAPVTVTAGADVMIDWSGVTEDINGNSLGSVQIERAALLETNDPIATIEEDGLATADWRPVAAGSSQSLSELGLSEGISEEKPVLLALFGSTGWLPWPISLTVLHPN